MDASLKFLLKQSSQIIEHQSELEELRGESFNIFSILNLETKEDITHSAFIGELLDPNGAHMMGHVFLELFIRTINHTFKFDCSSASLAKEHYIGKVNWQKKTGGRIDIFIKDKNGSSISIENKIYAGDQKVQIERYVNHNSSKNTVYYLTLEGYEPEVISKGELRSKKDFYCLSYSDDIIKWLEKCVQQSVSKPFIRESIRQYILLIKKLTGQLSDNEMENKIVKLIHANYESARAIANNIEKAEFSAANSLFLKIQHQIQDELQKTKNSKWTVSFEQSDSMKGSELSLNREGFKDFWITFEGDNSYIHKKNIFCGIYADTSEANKLVNQLFNNDVEDEEYIQSFKSEKNYPLWRYIDGMNFSLVEDRSKLFDPKEQSEMVANAVNLIIELMYALEKRIQNRNN